MSDTEIDFRVETLIFQKEIDFLQDEGAILLGAIQIFEDYMILKTKQKVTENDLKEMEEMIKKFLRVLSLIDAYHAFQNENQKLSDENIDSFTSLVSTCYWSRLNKFTNDIESSLQMKWFFFLFF